MSDSPVIVCEDVSKSYMQGNTRIEVFEHINLTVQPGERISIVGVSGAGKSSLLHLMGGLDKPSSGKIFIQGENVASLSERKLGKLRNRALGFVYQFHHLLPEFTVLENTSMPLLIGGQAYQQAAEAAKSILERVGLDHRLNHKPSELSGGERQRAAIARALVTSPVCMMADEPTGNLDSKTAGRVYDLFLELNQEMNTSLVMVTHDESLAARMQRTLYLKDGQLHE